MPARLFFDDTGLVETAGVVREIHAPRKLPEPVISGRESWQSPGEDARVYLYGTVLPSEGDVGYRMWYMRYPDRVLYAESDDGVRWRRPALGLVDVDGSTANNRLPVSLHSPSLVHDALDPDPARRYRMLGVSRDPAAKGYAVATSGDGLRWRLSDANPVFSGGDTCTLARDAVTGTHLAFHKRYHAHRGQDRRLVYCATSADLRTWTEPVLVLAPDDADDALTRSEGGRFSQFYNMSAFRCEDLWVGFVTHFRYTGEPPVAGPDQSRHDGPIDVQLVHSRDGRTWRRTGNRAPVIPNGPGDYDAGCILGVANSPVEAGDEVWLYYTAITTTHGGFTPQKRITIARAAWRRHGWVSLTAGGEEGIVRTAPAVPGGRRLTVNADARNGEVAVELRSPDGSPVPGFRMADAIPLRGDGVRLPVNWRSRDRIAPDRPVVLRFRLRNAALFSYAFE